MIALSRQKPGDTFDCNSKPWHCLLGIALAYLFIAWLTGTRLACLCQQRAVNFECHTEIEFNQSHPGPESIKRYQDVQTEDMPDACFVGFSLFRILKYNTWTRGQTPYLYDLRNNNKILDESR